MEAAWANPVNRPISHTDTISIHMSSRTTTGDRTIGYATPHPVDMPAGAAAPTHLLDRICSFMRRTCRSHGIGK